MKKYADCNFVLKVVLHDFILQREVHNCCSSMACAMFNRLFISFSKRHTTDRSNKTWLGYYVILSV